MVQINTPTEEDDVWGMIAGRSIPGLSFSTENPPGSGDYISLPIGTSYTGVTTESLQKRQATDYNDRNKLKFYDPIEKGGRDSQPIYDLIATLQTDYADPNDDDDDGVRRLFFTGQMRRALQDEVRRLGIKRFGIGTRITVTLTGFKPNPKGKPTKLFNVDLTPTEWVSAEQQATEAVLTAGGPVAASQAPAQFPTAAQLAAQNAVAVQPAPVAAAPVAMAAPVAPAPAADPNAALAAAMAALNAPAPTPGIVITQEMTAKVELLKTAGFDRATAIQAVATQIAPGNEEFRAALDSETLI